MVFIFITTDNYLRSDEVRDMLLDEVTMKMIVAQIIVVTSLLIKMNGLKISFQIY